MNAQEKWTVAERMLREEFRSASHQEICELADKLAVVSQTRSFDSASALPRLVAHLALFGMAVFIRESMAERN